MTHHRTLTTCLVLALCALLWVMRCREAHADELVSSYHWPTIGAKSGRGYDPQVDGIEEEADVSVIRTRWLSRYVPATEIAALIGRRR
ncbi:MAG: hypothetical protein V1755_14495 [Chloroflexota bacterium]